jgi:hypothetical protein
VPSILIAWELGSGLGHVGRLRPIAAALVDRGHNVTLAGRDTALCHRIFGPIGARVLQAPLLPEANPRIRIPCTFADVLHDSGFRHSENLPAAVNAWRNILQIVKADLVLTDHSPTALLACRGLSISSAVVGTGFLCPPNVSPLPSLRRSVSNPPWAAEIESLVLKNMNEVLDRIKAPRLCNIAQLYADVDLRFLLTLPEIDHYTGRDEAKYLRPICEIDGEDPVWPRGDGRKAFVYLKNHPGLHEVLESLARTDTSILCFVPELDVAVERRLPTTRFRVVRRPQDIREAARQSDAAITNGGHGAACEFLLAGTPLIVLPMNLEQQVTGQRVADLGAGVMGSLRKPTEVAQMLRRLLATAEASHAAQEFSYRYCHLRNEDSIASIIVGIERYLTR